jgi:SNF2 family DNA or RNA helicase
MKQVRHFKGEAKRNAIEHPEQFFDGVLESVVLPYGRRVEGVGEFQFVSTPHVPKTETIFGTDPVRGSAGPGRESHVECVDSVSREHIRIDFPNQQSVGDFRDRVGSALEAGANSMDYDGRHIVIDEELHKALDDGLSRGPTAKKEKTISEQGKKYLLIYTDDGELKEWDKQDAARASIAIQTPVPFERPESLADGYALKEHQVYGIQWLQNCHRLIGADGRRGSLLADDMGLGKTLQILTYLAWCIESNHDLNLSSSSAPWRPILIVMPLVLLENEVWQKDMRKFFKGGGSVFEPILSFHGDVVKQFVRSDAKVGREVTLWKSVLDVTRFQQYRVVITNYETIVNYQYSFAQHVDGQSIWSVVITDEAQEYKTPNSKISHAIKALDPSFRLASTGTPVENKLLDLWNLIDAQQPALLGTAKQFSSTYESGQDDTPGTLDALRTKLLFGKPNAFVLRRDKSELPDFPKKVIHLVDCWMSDFEVAMHIDLLKMLPEHRRSGNHFKILNQLVLLYQHPQLLKKDQGYLEPGKLKAESAKLRGVIEILQEVRRRREKAIIFSYTINMQQILKAVLSAEFNLNVQIINGSQSQQQGTKSSETTARTKSARQQKLDDFESGE